MHPRSPDVTDARGKMPELSDETLIVAAKTGDRAALEALLVRHTPAVLRFANRLCDDPADADDVVQETLIAAVKGLGNLREAAAMRSWLFSIARSFAARQRRRRTADPLDDAVVAHAGPGPDDVAAGVELDGSLDEAIRALDPKYREVLVLRDVEGLTAPEVADAIGVGVDTVKTRLHRARAAVRLRLAPARAPGPGAACPDVVERFSAFLEGEIGSDECLALQSHVNDCPSCNAACTSLKRTVNLCRESGAEVPSDVQARVRGALSVVVGPRV